MNRISITGHLGGDPKNKDFGNGKNVANFSVSYNNPYAKDGDEPLWLNVEGWNGLSKSILRDLKKGDKVLVSGRFTMNYDSNGKGYPTIVLTEPVEYINVKKFNTNRRQQVQPQVQQQNSLSGFTQVHTEAPFDSGSGLY